LWIKVASMTPREILRVPAIMFTHWGE